MTRARYHSDPEYRRRIIDQVCNRQRERLATEPGYAARRKLYAHEYHKRQPEPDLLRDAPKRSDRFWGNIAIGTPSECWLWQKGRNRQGYGLFKIGKRMFGTHRIAFVLTKGDIGSLKVLHRCDNPPCCNPAHLFLGTQRDNVADMDRKGRRRNPRLRCGEENSSTKLTKADVRAIRRKCAEGCFQRDVAKMYGVSQGQVSNIIQGKSWRHLA